MRVLIALVVAALFPFGSTAGHATSAGPFQNPAQNWTESRSPAGGFRVLFPSAPAHEVTEVPTRIGPIQMQRWFFEVGPNVYQLIYADYPEAYVKSTSADAMLDSALAQMRESVKPGSSFESVIPITMAGHPGREHVQDVDGFTMKGRSVLVGTRLYQVLVGVPSDRRAASLADIDRFLDSFALIARAPSVAPPAPQWTELVSREGGFRALLPGQATYSVQTVPTDVGPVQMHVWALVAGGSDYAILYGDYPEAHVRTTGAETIVRNVVNGLRESWKPGSVFESETLINLGSYPGREFSLDAAGFISKGRTLLVDNRLYQVLARAPNGQRASAMMDIDRFLTSFSIIATSKGAPR
jgi:hypothetical protein